MYDGAVSGIRRDLPIVLELALALCVACGSKGSKDQEEPLAAPAKTATDAAPAAKKGKVREAEAPKLDPVAYKAELDRGRVLEGKNDHEGAIAAFQKALVAMPGDASALSELSWAAFQKGDLALAKDAGFRAVASARKDQLEAAALYNLGRVAEKEGDKTGAIALYRRSLDLRSNRIVRNRIAALGALDERVAEALMPASGESLCPEQGSEEDDGEPCWEEPMKGEIARPFLAVLSVSGGFQEQYYSFGVRTKKGLFASNSLYSHHSKADAGLSMGDLSIAGDDASGNPVIRFEWESRDSGAEPYEMLEEDYEAPAKDMIDRHVVFCGVGASGNPSCVDIGTGDGVAMTLEGRGKLVIAVNREARAEYGHAAGTYKLVFP